MSATAKRTLVIEIVAVVVALGLLLWAAEALARTAAEGLLRRNVQQVTGVTQTPVVSIGPDLSSRGPSGACTGRCR